MAYEIGDDIAITAKFRRSTDKALIDPTAWQVRVQPPEDAPGGALPEETVLFGGPSGAYVTLSKIADGHFEILLSTDRANGQHAGRWTLWVTAIGVGKSSRSHHVVVDPPALDV